MVPTWPLLKTQADSMLKMVILGTVNDIDDIVDGDTALSNFGGNDDLED